MMKSIVARDLIEQIHAGTERDQETRLARLLADTPGAEPLSGRVEGHSAREVA